MLSRSFMLSAALPFLFASAAIEASGQVQEAGVEQVEARWPRDYVAEDGTRVRVYQPQIDSWDDYTTIEFRAAAAFYRPDRDEPYPAALLLRATTQTSFVERTVELFDVQLIDANFPTADEATARLLRRTLESMATPSSVKTRGTFRRPPLPSFFEVTVCDFKASHSAFVSLNAKSSGKRSRFRETAWFSAFVSTP